MKNLKKLLALALAVIMMLSVTPVVFAAEEEETTTQVATDTTEDEGLTAGDLFGGFFIKLGELLNKIFEFLSNMFSGTGGNNALEQIK